MITSLASATFTVLSCDGAAVSVTLTFCVTFQSSVGKVSVEGLNVTPSSSSFTVTSFAGALDSAICAVWAVL